ncbi:hypothetical protein MASR1M32_02150 [Rhodobacter sp.]
MLRPTPRFDTQEALERLNGTVPGEGRAIVWHLNGRFVRSQGVMDPGESFHSMERIAPTNSEIKQP